MKRLAQPPTSLLGRGPELDALVELVLQGTRLVTLTGLGGIGKSRLALAAAHTLAKHRPVAHVAALAATTEVELMVCIAEACTLTLDPRREPLDALVVALGTLGPHVIVVDDFEHLAARATSMLEHLLAYSDASFIVTSRVALDRPSETVVGVRPLAPELATALLIERAGRRAGWAEDDPSLSRLATRLDGIPLALELVAARARIASPRELLATLDSDLALRRGDSARDATVRWSYDALDERMRAALAALAAIGVFDLAGASAAIGVGVADALVIVDALERVSLLLPESTATGTRFRVLETVREFAMRHTDPAALDAARARFVDALLDGLAPTFDRAAPWPPGQLERIFELREHVLGCAREALARPTPSSMTRALRAAAAVLAAFERLRLPLAIGMPFVDVLRHPAAREAPDALRLAAAIAATLFVMEKVGGRALIAELEASMPTPDGGPEGRRMRVELRIRRLWDAAMSWDLAGHVVDTEPARIAAELGDESARLRAVSYEVFVRRALGLARLGVDDRRMEDEVLRRAEHLGWKPHVVAASVTSAFVCGNLGDHAGALRHVAHGLAQGLSGFEMMLVRERARVAADAGRLAAAATEFAESAETYRARASEQHWVETTLDSIGLALERGDLTAARAGLVRVTSSCQTLFDHHAHHALSTALAALCGEARPPALELRPTGTVEDTAFAAWRAIGTDATIDRAAAAHSARARQALRVLDATRDGLLVSLDDQRVRVAGTWLDLAPKPALRIIWHLLVSARFATIGAGVDRQTLAAALWPGEKLKPEARDNRLQVNLATLRKQGLADVVEAHDGGYRIVPGVLLARVDAQRWF